MKQLTEQQKEIVENNINLIHHILKQYNFASLGTQDYNDYFQQGAYGLCLAAQRFDENRGIAFTTFAGIYINGYILRYYRDFAQGPIRPTRQQLGAKERILYIYYNATLNDNDGNETEILERLQFESSDSYFDNDIIFKVDFESLKSSLSLRENQVLDLAMADVGQVKSAEIIGISQPQIGRIKKKIYNKIKAVI